MKMDEISDGPLPHIPFGADSNVLTRCTQAICFWVYPALHCYIQSCPALPCRIEFDVVVALGACCNLLYKETIAVIRRRRGI